MATVSVTLPSGVLFEKLMESIKAQLCVCLAAHGTFGTTGRNNAG